MKIIAISRKKAEEIGKRTGFPITENNGRTFYATNEEQTEIWEFDSKRERDNACESE